MSQNQIWLLDWISYEIFLTQLYYKHKISINVPHPGFSANLTWPDPLEVRKLLWSFCLSLQYSLAFENKKKISENNSYQIYICRNYFICTWHIHLHIKFSISTTKVNFKEQNYTIRIHVYTVVCNDNKSW